MVAEPMTVAAPRKRLRKPLREKIRPLTPAKKLWTYEEIQATFHDDVRRELYDGEIFEMPSPAVIHQRILESLGKFLLFWAAEHGGEIVRSPIDMRVTARRYYQPDLVFYSAQTLSQQEVWSDRQYLVVPPQLIIEVLSPSTARNDRIRKTRAYAEFGVPHYWLIDPEARTLEALELQEGRYFIAHILEGDESFQPALFPGLTLALTEIFPPHVPTPDPTNPGA